MRSSDSVAIPFRTGFVSENDMFLHTTLNAMSQSLSEQGSFQRETHSPSDHVESQSLSEQGSFQRNEPSWKKVNTFVAIPFRTGFVSEISTSRSSFIKGGRNPFQNRVRFREMAKLTNLIGMDVAIPFRTGFVSELSAEMSAPQSPSQSLSEQGSFQRTVRRSNTN